MAIDVPLEEDTTFYATNTFTGDGSQTSFELSLADGYISTAHIKSFATDLTGNKFEAPFTWLGPNTIETLSPIPSGWTLTVYRDTPKDAPIVNFTDGAILTEHNLDLLATQAVFLGAEAFDKYNGTLAAVASLTERIDDAAPLPANVMIKDGSNVLMTVDQAAEFREAIGISTPYNDVTAIKAGTYNVGERIDSSMYGGSTWIVKSEVVLQNHFSGEPLSSSKITFDDELHILVDLEGGGTGVAECQLGSIQGYVMQRATELYNEFFARNTRRSALSSVGKITVYGDSIVYGQVGAQLAEINWVSTGWPDGSKHQFAHAANPWPARLKTKLDLLTNGNKIAVVNKGYSGDRIGSGYCRHRTAESGSTMAVIAYGTNDVLYGSNNGINPENLFDTTPEQATDYRFSLFTPALRKFVYRATLRGEAVLLESPDAFRSLTGYDGTDISAAKVLSAFRTAIKGVANEVGVGYFDIADTLFGYDNDYLTLDGTHLADEGAEVRASRYAGMFNGQGWREHDRVSGTNKLRVSPIYSSLGGRNYVGDFVATFDSNSLGAPFVNATDGLDMLIDTNKVYVTVISEVDELCVIPVGYIASGGTVNLEANFGVAQPSVKLNLLATGVPGDALTWPPTVAIAAGGAQRVINNASELGSSNILRLIGKGVHTIAISATAQIALISGLAFGEWDTIQPTVAAPTGGATVDAEARAAIASVINRLKALDSLAT